MKKIYFILLALLSLNIILPVLAIESEPIQQVKSKDESEEMKDSFKWTETMRLRDFYLSPGFLELKDKVEDYRKTLAKQYTETPDVFSTAIEYGILLIDSGKIDDADMVLSRAVLDFRNNPTPKVYKAWVDACKGNYLEAKNVWYEIAKEKLDRGVVGYGAGIWLPYHVDAVLGLYLIKDYLSEKDKQEVGKAVEDIAKHFAARPKFASILIAKDIQTGQLKSASDKLTQFLNSGVEDPMLITLLGITQLVTEHYDEALKLFDKSNELYPYSPTNRLMRARALYALKNKKEAENVLSEAIKLDPGWKDKGISNKKILALRSYSSPIKIHEPKEYNSKVREITELKSNEEDQEAKKAIVPEKP